MLLGFTLSPHFKLRIALLGIVTVGVCASAFCQNGPVNQNSAPNPPPAVEDPMGLPPRTAEPPDSVRQQADQEPGAKPDSQTSTSEDQGRFIFKKQVQEVVLHATVVDETGRLVKIGR